MSERYNGAMLNGQLMPSTELNQKNFSYDIIPANIINNIIVYKTIMPDMSAEFGGGLVDVETKTIPTSIFFSGKSFEKGKKRKAYKTISLYLRTMIRKPCRN